MSNVKNFITYNNWAYIDHEYKKGNLKPSLDIQYDDIYLPESFTALSKPESVMPIITMFRTQDKKLAGKFEYNFKDKSYDYFFYGNALSGYVFDALNKYLKAQKYYGEFAVYLNSVSSDNLLFNSKVQLIDTK